jgi:hypothetical protein
LAVLLPMLALLAGCDAKSPLPQIGGNDAGDELDRLAIEKGLLPDPQSLALEGRYETRSELGTDKFCAVADDGRYRIGFLSVYGPESKCEGQGTAEQNGDVVRVTLIGKAECAFEASYDGIVLRFPGAVPESCAAYCSRNANMSGTRYYFVDPGAAAARKTLGRDFERLCS